MVKIKNGNKEIDAMVVDLCPVKDNEQWCSGDKPHFDLGTQKTFEQLENYKSGVKDIKFDFIPKDVGSSKVRLHFKGKASDKVNPWWVALMVVNTRYRVSKVEILHNDKWILGEKLSPTAFWSFGFSGAGIKPPFKIKITDHYGQTIEEIGNSIQGGFLWTGANQFPLMPQHKPSKISIANGNSRSNLTISSQYERNMNVSLFDINGRAITLLNNVKFPPDDQQISLNGVPKGIYIVNMRNSEGEIVLSRKVTIVD